jgi:hypothetical protein
MKEAKYRGVQSSTNVRCCFLLHRTVRYTPLKGCTVVRCKTVNDFENYKMGEGVVIGWQP